MDRCPLCGYDDEECGCIFAEEEPKVFRKDPPCRDCDGTGEFYGNTGVRCHCIDGELRTDLSDAEENLIDEY